MDAGERAGEGVGIHLSVNLGSRIWFRIIVMFIPVGPAPGTVPVRTPGIYILQYTVGMLGAAAQRSAQVKTMCYG